MPPKQKAFTLIELLVVVLIIAILAAVALPQYRKAVLKSRLAESYVIAHQAKEQMELFFWEHDRMPNLAELPALLDIADLSCSSDCKAQEVGKVSGTCTCTAGDYAFLYKVTSKTKHMMYAMYAPNGVSSQQDPVGSGFWINTAEGFHPVLACVSNKNSTLATQLCKQHSTNRLENNDGMEWYPMQ